MISISNGFKKNILSLSIMAIGYGASFCSFAALPPPGSTVALDSVPLEGQFVVNGTSSFNAEITNLADNFKAGALSVQTDVFRIQLTSNDHNHKSFQIESSNGGKAINSDFPDSPIQLFITAASVDRQWKQAGPGFTAPFYHQTTDSSDYVDFFIPANAVLKPGVYHFNVNAVEYN